MASNIDCPYEIIPITEEDSAIENGPGKKYRMGPKGYLVGEEFLKHTNDVRRFHVRSDDVFVLGFFRSGTTMTEEMVWLISNDLDFERAKSTSLDERSLVFEGWNGYQKLVPATDCDTSPAEYLGKLPGPRFFKSHMPLSFLPEDLLNTAKVVYLARNVLDVAVSLYFHKKSYTDQMREVPFKNYFEELKKGNDNLTPYFEHVKEGWAVRNHPNVLFLFYEELSKDLKGTAKRVADFLGKSYPEQEMDKLCEHLKFENLQKNNAVSNRISHTYKKNNRIKLIRKGVVGGWRDHFDEEMTQEAVNWIKKELQGTDLLQYYLPTV